MAAARAYWSGHLRLSLVSIPVKLYSATKTASRIQLHQIHEPSGKRIRYEKVAPGLGPVDKEEIIKGYEHERGSYVLLKPEELDALKLETRQTITLVQFVEPQEIAPLYYERPYYLAHDGDAAEEGYRVIRDALRQSGKVALGQLAMRGREHLIAIRPCGRGLLLETLRYADEVRDADQIFDDVADEEPPDEMLDLANELIERKSAPFDAGAYQDNYETALRQLIETKLDERREITVATDEGGDRGKVIDLMEALKQSVGDGKKGGSGARKSGQSRKAESPRGQSSSGKSTGSKSTGSKSTSGKSAGSGGGRGRRTAGGEEGESGAGGRRKSA